MAGPNTIFPCPWFTCSKYTYGKIILHKIEKSPLFFQGGVARGDGVVCFSVKTTSPYGYSSLTRRRAFIDLKGQYNLGIKDFFPASDN